MQKLFAEVICQSCPLSIIPLRPQDISLTLTLLKWKSLVYHAYHSIIITLKQPRFGKCPFFTYWKMRFRQIQPQGHIDLLLKYASENQKKVSEYCLCLCYVQRAFGVVLTGTRNVQVFFYED